jgi:hypothetical protein
LLPASQARDTLSFINFNNIFNFNVKLLNFLFPPCETWNALTIVIAECSSSSSSRYTDAAIIVVLNGCANGCVNGCVKGFW